MNLNKNLIILLLAGLFSGHLIFGQETKQIVQINNIEKVNGNLYIGWYNHSATFRINDQAIYREKLFVSNKEEVNVIFTNIPKGVYAIAVFLDANDNYKLDRNFFRIPKEKYGFSNNILKPFRPATFEESVFHLTENEVIINIKLK